MNIKQLRNSFHSIPVRLCTGSRRCFTQNSCLHVLENLVSVCRINNSTGVKSLFFLRLSDLNVRSAGNKAMAITCKSLNMDNDTDVLTSR